MLFYFSCSALLRALNHDMGAPVNRFVIFARAAARGFHLREQHTDGSGGLHGIVSRSADTKEFQTWQDRFSSMRELMSFEWQLQWHSFKAWFWETFFKVGIFFGFLQRLDLQEMQEEAFAAG